MTSKDSANGREGRDTRPAPALPEALPQRTLPGVPAPTGDGMGAGEATGLVGGDASMTEANLALDTDEASPPTAEH
ncbi:hypothetical protein GCM10010840_04810 [Deinococcus aerolatus]|uniref:Uncharacterized protein n=1 Tax=Deinococcus aerolatus TaxID=522487 RepID=A0ABQ2G100_9DEIO|nr:hypothetical protein [Deinococcus aerolatus]GGL69758.1 hypothetical protein GCM10010840_04810 [Deinococcus aerolatus]